MSYCVGVNRIGDDENGYQYNGHTSAYNFLGEKIASKDVAAGDLNQQLFDWMEDKMTQLEGQKPVLQERKP